MNIELYSFINVITLNVYTLIILIKDKYYGKDDRNSR
jgi:hypothetical protein